MVWCRSFHYLGSPPAPKIRWTGYWGGIVELLLLLLTFCNFIKDACIHRVNSHPYRAHYESTQSNISTLFQATFLSDTRLFSHYRSTLHLVTRQPMPTFMIISECTLHRVIRLTETTGLGQDTLKKCLWSLEHRLWKVCLWIKLNFGLHLKWYSIVLSWNRGGVREVIVERHTAAMTDSSMFVILLGCSIASNGHQGSDLYRQRRDSNWTPRVPTTQPQCLSSLT